MEYRDVVTAFLDPATADHPVPQAVSAASPARQLRDAFEPLSMHAVWSPLVHERMAAHGLDFFGTYVWGRACVMGEPSGAVVAAAFAAFEPSMIAGIYDQARAALDHANALRLTRDSTAESLRTVLADADDSTVSKVADQLAGVVDALDPTGRPLFSGVRSLDWPDDPFGRLWQSCLALREHRGDAHVAAYLVAGFTPVEMNLLTELWLGYPLGEYSGSRAWPEEATAAALASLRNKGLVDGEQITSDGVAARDGIEANTDAMSAGAVDMLGASAEAVVGQLAVWSGQCVSERTFPPDPRKRAAG